MYLNDHQRDAFYSSLGMNTTLFNQHVIIETNNTTARIFPEVKIAAAGACPLASCPSDVIHRFMKASEMECSAAQPSRATEFTKSAKPH